MTIRRLRAPIVAALAFAAGAVVQSAIDAPDLPAAPRAAAERPAEAPAMERGAAEMAAYAALRRSEEARAGRADSALAGVPSLFPVGGGRVSSTYTMRRFHPVLKQVLPHRGVDIAAPVGTGVIATADGEVLYVVRNRTYGLLVDVRHGERFITRYAHLSAAAVRAGQQVRRGEVIGQVGESGLASGPNLHYEVFVDGRRRDPVHFLGFLGDPETVP